MFIKRFRKVAAIIAVSSCALSISPLTISPASAILVMRAPITGGEFSVVGSTPSAGSLDESFGTGGMTSGIFDIPLIPIGYVGTYNYSEAESLAVQPDGKIVVVGRSGIGEFAGNESPANFVVKRYNVNGTLDQTFGVNGTVITPVGVGFARANSVAIDSQGRIVVAGEAEVGLYGVFGVVRYLSNGSLDTDFNANGIVTTSFYSTKSASVNSVAVDSTDKIIVVGQTDTLNRCGSICGDRFYRRDTAIIRFKTDGTLDDTFDVDGKATVNVKIVDQPNLLSANTVYDQGSGAHSVIIDSDNNIVIAGYAYYYDGDGDYYGTSLLRYTSDGFDLTFGTGTQINSLSGAKDGTQYSLSMDTTGRFVVAASIQFNNWDIALLRYDSTGLLDSSFGGDGMVTTDMDLVGVVPNGGIDNFARSVVIDSTNRIVVAGLMEREYFVARYLPESGLLDPDFSGDGVSINDLGLVRTYDPVTEEQADYSREIKDIAITPSGKIVIAGFTRLRANNYSSGSVFSVVQYNSTDSETPSGPGTQTAEEIAAAAREAARIADELREAKKRKARADLTNPLATTTLDTFADAECLGINVGNLKDVASEVKSLSTESRSDITQILKICRKFEVVDKVATRQIIYPMMLQEIGLISLDSKYKSTLTVGLRKLPVDKTKTYAQIQTALAAHMKVIQGLKSRLAATLERIAALR